MQGLIKYKSPTYQFHNWLGETRTIYLTVEQGRIDFEVIVHTANLDGSHVNKNIWSKLHPLDDTPLNECWENCLATFKEYYAS